AALFLLPALRATSHPGRHAPERAGSARGQHATHRRLAPWGNTSMEMKRALATLLALTACLAPLRASPPAAREPGSVLLIAGQAREEFRDYLVNVTGQGRHAPRPVGAAFYTSLNLTGLRSPHANEPGDHHQDMEYLRM